MNPLQKIQNEMAKEIYGKTKSEALESGLCISCSEPAIPKCYSEAGREEFKISGLCEICFDEICEG